MSAGSSSALGYGPVHSTPTGYGGWVAEYAKNAKPTMHGGTLKIQGDTRAYLVQDHTRTNWNEHKYVRYDLSRNPLQFTMDLSGVPCGCLACVYVVAMPDPSGGSSKYCDMAENIHPGIGGDMCTELDFLEANSHAMQTAIHTELGNSFGSRRCDRNGCVYHVPSWAYGTSGQINSHHPFDVTASVDGGSGELRVKLEQGGHSADVFSKSMAGNPQGSGVPWDSLQATNRAQGKLALVGRRANHARARTRACTPRPDTPRPDRRACASCAAVGRRSRRCDHRVRARRAGR